MLSLQLIRKTLLSPEGQRILEAMPAVETYSGRMAYARAVCERFAFVDARGVLRAASCIA